MEERVSRFEVTFQPNEASTFAVTVAVPYTIGDEQHWKEIGPMPPDVAEKRGHDLSKIIASLNVSALKDVAAQRSALFAVNEEYNRYKEITTAKLEEAKTLMDAAERAFAAQEADAKSKSEEIADLKAKLAEMEALAVEPRSDG